MKKIFYVDFTYSLSPSASKTATAATAEDRSCAYMFSLTLCQPVYDIVMNSAMTSVMTLSSSFLMTCAVYFLYINLVIAKCRNKIELFMLPGNIFGVSGFLWAALVSINMKNNKLWWFTMWHTSQNVQVAVEKFFDVYSILIKLTTDYSCTFFCLPAHYVGIMYWPLICTKFCLFVYIVPTLACTVQK